MTLDNLHMARISAGGKRSPALEVTHLWHAGSTACSHGERLTEPQCDHEYQVRTSAMAHITNDAVSLYGPLRRFRGL